MNAITTATTASAAASIGRHERGHANGAPTRLAAGGFKATTTQANGKQSLSSTVERRRSPLAIARIIMAVLFVAIYVVGCNSSRINSNAPAATVVGSLQQLANPMYGYLDSSASLDELSTTSGNNYLICTKGKSS